MPPFCATHVLPLNQSFEDADYREDGGNIYKGTSVAWDPEPRFQKRQEDRVRFLIVFRCQKMQI